MPDNQIVSVSGDPGPHAVLNWIMRYRDAANEACSPRVTPVPQDPYYNLIANLVAAAEQLQTIMVIWGCGYYYLSRLLANFDFRRRRIPKPDPTIAWSRLELSPSYPDLVRQRVAEAAREVDDLESMARRRMRHRRRKHRNPMPTRLKPSAKTPTIIPPSLKERDVANAVEKALRLAKCRLPESEIIRISGFKKEAVRKQLKRLIESGRVIHHGTRGGYSSADDSEAKP